MTTLEKLLRAARAAADTEVVLLTDEDVEHLVCAVLTELLHPTTDMGLAGAAKVNEHMRGPGAPADYDAAMDSFTAMISEILKEGR